jgi:hypothetical protein
MVFNFGEGGLGVIETAHAVGTDVMKWRTE